MEFEESWVNKITVDPAVQPIPCSSQGVMGFAAPGEESGRSRQRRLPRVSDPVGSVR